MGIIERKITKVLSLLGRGLTPKKVREKEKIPEELWERWQRRGILSLPERKEEEKENLEGYPLDAWELEKAKNLILYHLAGKDGKASKEETLKIAGKIRKEAILRAIENLEIQEKDGIFYLPSKEKTGIINHRCEGCGSTFLRKPKGLKDWYQCYDCGLFVHVSNLDLIG